MKERYDKVRQMAKRITKNVQKTKIMAVLDSMPNDDVARSSNLIQDAKHQTMSEGDGRNRRLRIYYDQCRIAFRRKVFITLFIV